MKQRILLIFACSTFLGVIGAGLSVCLPNQYTAKGLLVVTRRTDTPSSQVFTYEGYYAEQNSGAYTGTFLSILISPDNFKAADNNLDPKRLSRLVKAKRDGTQAIALSVKGQTPQNAWDLWNKVADSAIQTHIKITNSADPLLAVTKTPGSPVIMKTYPDWPSIFGASFAFSFVILSSIIVTVRYLKEAHDN